MESNSNPRNYATNLVNKVFNTKSTNSNIIPTSSSNKSSVNNQVYSDYSGYTESIVGSNPIAMDNNTINSYNNTVKQNTKYNIPSKVPNGYGLFNGDISNSGSQGDKIYDKYGNIYYNNGDGTATNMETSDIMNIQDIEKQSRFTANSVGTLYKYALIRAGLTGNSGIWGAIANSKFLKPKEAHTLFGKLGNMVKRTSNASFNILKGAGNFADKKAVSSVGDDIVKGAAESVDDLGQVADRSSGIIKKFFTKIDDFFKAATNSAVIKEAFKNVLKGSGKEYTETATKKGLKKVVEESSSALKKVLNAVIKKAPQKAASILGKFIPILNIAFFIRDFTDGFRNAASYLGILEEDVTVVEKFVCGFAQLINGVVTLGIVPLSTIIDIITEVIMPILNISTDDIDKMRKYASEEFQRYNEKNGTNYTMKEYNNKDKWTTKVANAVKSAFTIKKPTKKNSYLDSLSTENQYN
jgi:hypothetical protein